LECREMFSRDMKVFAYPYGVVGVQ